MTRLPTEADDPGALVARAVVRVAVRAVVQLSLRALALHLQSAQGDYYSWKSNPDLVHDESVGHGSEG